MLTVYQQNYLYVGVIYICRQLVLDDPRNSKNMTTNRHPTSPLPPRAVVAILRAPTAQHFIAASSVLWDAGIRCFEFTLTSDGALEAVSAFRERKPEAILGVGTVRTVQHLAAAQDAGAAFAVSQVFLPRLVDRARELRLPFVPGALSPTEIVTAWESGVSLVKVSPIGPLGGVSYLNELRGPLPDIAMMPTGGVTLDAAGDYLAAGAAAVGVSGAVFGNALRTGDLTGLADRASHLTQLLAGV
jgi:2-dehydro-3-deoxyphosphogluconate aldolase / (4S)-4-hydroxy-2-oxoglutarate aldolase